MWIETSWSKKAILTITKRQLTHKFGLLNPELEAQLADLSQRQLEDLAEALLDFSEVAQLEAWMQANPEKVASEVGEA